MIPFEQQVRERAYFIWEGEGRVFGRADDHWLRAEAELVSTRGAGPLQVRPAAADLTLAPSPAQALDKTLKAKATRSRTAAAKAVTAEAKPAQAKPAKDKTAAAKATATKTATTKTAATKTAATKTAATKAAPVRTAPKATSRASAESAATVH